MQTTNILCFHGWLQSKQKFYQKTGAFRKNLLKHNISLHFIDAPFVAKPPSHAPPDSTDYRTWVNANEDFTSYGNWQHSAEYVLEYMKQNGPFDGVLGFSQGGFVATLVALLANPTCIDESYPLLWELSERMKEKNLLPDVKFAILVGSLVPNAIDLRPEFLRLKVDCPSIHVMGEEDKIISVERSELLMGLYCNEKKLKLVHTGGHVVPHGKLVTDGIAQFIQEVQKV